MKVADLMNRIHLHEIALPEFQREYVWEVEQAQQLLQSLYRAYPTGSLLFWETTTPPAIKRAQAARELAGLAEDRGWHLWIFRSAGDPQLFLECSESRTAGEHRAIAERPADERRLEERIRAVATYQPDAWDLWEEARN